MPVTPEKILTRIHSAASSRAAKKLRVIHDGDYSAEIDDQYALLYLLGCPHIELLGTCAEAYYEPSTGASDTAEVMEWSYRELARVYDALHIDREKIPMLRGASSQITNNPGNAPSDSPAVRYIIERALDEDDLLFVVSTGPCTSAVSAWLLEPRIRDRLCVVWLGSDCPERTGVPFYECNMFADPAASRMLLDLDIPLILLPCAPDGSVKIHLTHRELGRLSGDSDGAVFFRKTLARLGCETDEDLLDNWDNVMCDLAGPAVLSVPDAMELCEIPAPIFGEDRMLARDPARRRILCGTHPDSDRIAEDFVLCANRAFSMFPAAEA